MPVRVAEHLVPQNTYLTAKKTGAPDIGTPGPRYLGDRGYRQKEKGAEEVSAVTRPLLLPHYHNNLYSQREPGMVVGARLAKEGRYQPHAAIDGAEGSRSDEGEGYKRQEAYA
jgi:hypothetical protein